MHHATLCYIFDRTNQDDIKVLLGMKKEGRFGAGKLNGFGGKVEPGETYEGTAIREMEAESGIEASDLEKVAELDFKFTNAPPGKDWDQVVHVYFAKSWKGTPTESNEMIPEWYSVEPFLNQRNKIYKKCWPDDKYWFPKVLRGKKLYGWIVFGKDNEEIASLKIEETANFKR
jgi:8-oxo-dGTP pyrophosphatase MutT (NUDIX family)